MTSGEWRGEERFLAALGMTECGGESSGEWLAGNSYRNLVSCCIECNSRKGDRPTPDFLRTLYRQGRLTPAELDGRLRALKALAAGKLRPVGSL